MVSQRSPLHSISYIYHHLGRSWSPAFPALFCRSLLSHSAEREKRVVMQRLRCGRSKKRGENPQESSAEREEGSEEIYFIDLWKSVARINGTLVCLCFFVGGAWRVCVWLMLCVLLCFLLSLPLLLPSPCPERRRHPRSPYIILSLVVTPARAAFAPRSASDSASDARLLLALH